VPSGLVTGSETPAPVTTFKRRGRVRAGQTATTERLWPRYGLDIGGGRLDTTGLFGRTAPLVVEVGFGRGEATLAMAAAEPGRDVLAIEVHRPGVAALLHGLEATGLSNVRVVVGDAVPVLENCLGPGVLDEVRVFFPDPWPKARHHKRRLIGPSFVRLVASRLRPAGTLGVDDPGGRLHCATDWEPYAEQMLTVVDAEPSLRNQFDGYAPRPIWRPLTRFERRGLDTGHTVRDLIAYRT
jgi:tRNA (guanine-N7-)-methyltransferase